MRRLIDGMSFRRRLLLAGTAAVAIAILLALGTAFAVVRSELRGQVDESLEQVAGRRADDVLFTRRVAGAEELPPDGLAVPLIRQSLSEPDQPLGGRARYVQIVVGDQVLAPFGGPPQLPADERARQIAKSGEGSYFSDVTLDGSHARVYTRALEPGVVIQAAQTVDDQDEAIDRLGLILAVVGVGGVGLAGGLGFVVTRTATRPVRELSQAAEHVARTRDLSRRIEARGGDELSRLAASFNTMLGALERSMRSQRQLVSDASHELRTPLTSVRTNLEVMARANGTLPEAERARMLRDVTVQLDELTGLVGDLVDLARDGAPDEPLEEVRLDLLVSEAVARARRLHPGREIHAELDATLVLGSSGRLDRAVTNLLDNAEKWSPPGTPIEVSVRDGQVVVRDHGPGFTGEDLPRVFDRFYRAPGGRGPRRHRDGRQRRRRRRPAAADGRAGPVTNRGPGGSLIPLAQCTIVGTPGADRIKGTSGNDVICGVGGNDVINGAGGIDIIDGANGNDRLAGGARKDKLIGLRGKDRLNGNAGNDRAGGGAGRDRVSGASGGDRLGGGSSRDRLLGGAGKDRLSARDGARDFVDGGKGKDRAKVDRLRPGAPRTRALRVTDRVRRVERRS